MKEKMFIDLTTGKIILADLDNNSQYNSWRDAAHPEGLYYSDGTLCALSLDEFVSRFKTLYEHSDHPEFLLCIDDSFWALDHINIMSSVGITEWVFEFCHWDRRCAILIDAHHQERAWSKFNKISEISRLELRRKLKEYYGMRIAPVLSDKSIKWKHLNASDFNDLSFPSEEIKKVQQKMMEEILLKEGYNGGFTTQTVYSAQDVAVIFDNANKNKKEKETMNKMDTIDEFYKYHTIYIHDDEIWFTYKNGDKGSSIIVSDKDGAKIVKEHKDEFILMLYQMHNFLPKSFLIFIPSEKKTIFRAVNNKEETVIKDSSKKKFDYIQAFFIGMTKYKMNYGKGRLSAVGYNWYDKLTNHRKIKEV